MKNIILFLLLSLNCISVFSAEQEKLTLASLEKSNYMPMTGAEMSEIILGKTLLLKDLLSQAVYEVKIDKDGLMKRRTVKEKSPEILTSVEYHSRAALLTEPVDMMIKGNKIMSTDGVRTYVSTLYKKGDDIYGVRDIDHNAVNFKIMFKK